IYHNAIAELSMHDKLPPHFLNLEKMIEFARLLSKEQLLSLLKLSGGENHETMLTLMLQNEQNHTSSDNNKSNDSKPLLLSDEDWFDIGKHLVEAYPKNKAFLHLAEKIFTQCYQRGNLCALSFLSRISAAQADFESTWQWIKLG